MQAALRQVRVAADQTEVAPDLAVRAKRRAVAPVEIGDLLRREVFEREPRADVERRLIEVGDEQVRLGRVGDGQRQAAPRPFGSSDRSLCQERKSPKTSLAKGAGEEAIHFVQPPDQRRLRRSERLALQVSARN